MEAYLADLDGTCSPLMSPWIDRGDWGQERVAPQKGDQDEEKKKTCRTSAKGCKVSVVSASESTNHSSIDRPLSGLSVSIRLGSSVSTPSRHSFQSERATDRVFKNPPPALREQLLSGVIKTKAEGDMPRSPGRGGGRQRPTLPGRESV